jgi:hypothetical protein
MVFLLVDDLIVAQKTALYAWTRKSSMEVLKSFEIAKNLDLPMGGGVTLPPYS